MKRISLFSPLKIFFLLIILVPVASSLSQTLISVAQSNFKWTGVAVSHEGRIFVNFPRWSSCPYSVAEILGGDLRLYPDTTWNSYIPANPPGSQFLCVQSVYIDDENYLWILDPGSPYLSSVVPGGAKLLKVDLTADTIVQIIFFDETTAPSNSYLNDVRIDTQLGYAYITDSNIGAIVVVNLNTGESRRLLADHYSTKAENITLIINGTPFTSQIHSDGLALNPDNSYLYYKALTGYNLYRISTDVLRDTMLTGTQVEDAVELVAETIPCDAIEFDADGNLFITAIEYNGIGKLTPNLELDIVIISDLLKWPDSFSITPDGLIYVTTSRIGFPPGVHEIFKIVDIPNQAGDDKGQVPKQGLLNQNFPNPFNPSTTIGYEVPKQNFVNLKVYNLIGEEISTLLNEEKPAGYYEVVFNTYNIPAYNDVLSSGFYFYQLQVDNYIETKRMLLLK